MNHSIYLNLSTLPLTHVSDYLTAEKPFIHADRILDFHVLIYLIKGGLSVIEDGQEYELIPGSLFFLKAGVHHWGKTLCKPGTAWFFVHFTLPQKDTENSLLSPYTTFIQNQEFLPTDYDNNIMLPKHLHLVNGNLIEGKLYRLVELFHSSNPLRAAYLNPLLMEILLDCYQNQQHIHQRLPEDNKIKSLIHYLEHHTNENFDSMAIAKHMNLSYKYLGELFKKKTGMTLVQYHTHLRMNEASKLLRETLDPITTISELIGYQDPLYFSNVFKKVHGISPKHYRQRYIS